MGVENGNQVCFQFCVNPIKRQNECSVDPIATVERNLMFIITTIQCIVTQDCVITLSDIEEVLDINNEKIRDLSENLLLGLAIYA